MGLQRFSWEVGNRQISISFPEDSKIDDVVDCIRQLLIFAGWLPAQADEIIRAAAESDKEAREGGEQ